MPRNREKKRLLFVLNPIAGGKKKQDIPSILKGFCADNGFLYDIFETTGKNDHQLIEDQLILFPYHGVVAIGGDGTVNLVGNVLVGKNIPLGILPMGSANGLAKDLDIPEEVDEALKIIAKFRPRFIDTLKVNGFNAFHISDLGFNARVIHRFAKSLLRGKFLYVWYGVLEFLTFKPFKYTIETPISRYDGEAFMMVITNASKFGTNVSINPLGNIRDGYFEIDIVRPFPKLHSFHIMYYLLSGKIHKSKYYKIIRTKRAVIYNLDNETFHIDGEPFPAVEKLLIEEFPKGLKVLLP
ncbi:diacylglycerol kinase family lipid kinase [Cytophagaceae bacterium ABcell3]|nr:diacylglycerol kinase family lipid kinase [Cytophagaceae bacterium ABcell3]